MATIVFDHAKCVCCREISAVVAKTDELGDTSLVLHQCVLMCFVLYDVWVRTSSIGENSSTTGVNKNKISFCILFPQKIIDTLHTSS